MGGGGGLGVESGRSLGRDEPLAHLVIVKGNSIQTTHLRL